MNEKVTKLLLNILKYLLSLLLGLYLAVIVTGSIMAFSQYKLEIGNHFKEVILSLLTHPLKHYLLYFNQRNPILILISIAVVLYLAYFLLKRKQKSNQWETDGKQTHGSAEWGKLNDVLDQYYKMTPKDITTNFENSFDKELLNQVTLNHEEVDV